VDAANLLSGLAGGVIGALTGAGVTVWAQWAEHRHQGQIAARAVHAEMGANVAELRLLLGAAASMQPLLMHAWELRAADVARILPAEEFYKVALAYALIPECQRIQQRFSARTGPMLKAEERALLEKVLPDLSQSNDILRKRAWRKGNAPTVEGITSPGG
jgi:hypothetical protein